MDVYEAIKDLPTPYYDDGDGRVIFCGDCRELLPLVGKVDLVLTDPKYGHGERWQGGTWGAAKMYKDALAWDAERTSDETIELVRTAGDQAIIWGGNYFSLPPSRCWLSWSKTTKMATLADFELAWTSYDKPSKQYDGNRSPKHGKIHATQKPLELFRWCLRFAGTPMLILDPFLGSGTTEIAARDCGCQAIGIEIEERYCEIAANRLRQKVLF